MNYPVSKLLIYIPFHFRRDRLNLFQQVLQKQLELAEKIDVHVATNTRNADELKEIYAIAPAQNERYSFTVETFDNLKHPMSLRWTHKALFKNAYYSDKNYTHFLVVDADSHFFAHNLYYWMNHREKLKPFGLYPGFIRLEWSLKKNDWVCSEASESMGQFINLDQRTTITIDGVQYSNMVNAYPGVSLYDRELLLEHMSSPSFHEHYRCNWGVGETAIAGQTFINIPPGFTSRTVFPFIRYFKLVDPNCFMHHLANNYADSHYNLLTPHKLFTGPDNFPKDVS